jgi:hypothetical protein
MADLDDVNDKIDEVISELQEIKSSTRNLEDVVSELRETKSVIRNIKESSTTLTEYAILLVLIAMVSNWEGSKVDRFTDRLWYSVRYDTAWKNVNVEKRPTDCDFLHAPIGTKQCSYKKDKSIFGEEQRRVNVESAPAEDKQAEANKPNMVFVYWGKKDEP